MLKRRNFLRNRQLEMPENGKMINGQALGKVSELRYGICRMSFNGCEVIAVHNALVYLGIPRPVTEIAEYMENFRMLFGFFGCSPYKTGKALEHFGAACRRTDAPPDEGAFIMTFWTKRPFMSSLHTVFCVSEKSGIRVYNIYNNCPDPRVYPSVEDFAGKRRPVAVFKLISKN